MPLRAVIFDLDDTLIAEESVARASLRSTANVLTGVAPVRVEETALSFARATWRAGPHHQVALDLGIASWEGLWATFEGSHPALWDLAAWVPTYRQQVWRATATRLGVDEPGVAGALAAAYERAQRAGHPLLDGAAETVRACSGWFRVGLLTNGPPDIQRLKLAQSGLEDAFHAVVVSGESGVGKPAPEAFGLVLGALGVDAKETIMVGDSWDRDVNGALSAGIRPIWVAHGRPVPRPDPSVQVISSIGELMASLVQSRPG